MSHLWQHYPFTSINLHLSSTQAVLCSSLGLLWHVQMCSRKYKQHTLPRGGYKDIQEEIEKVYNNVNIFVRNHLFTEQLFIRGELLYIATSNGVSVTMQLSAYGRLPQPAIWRKCTLEPTVLDILSIIGTRRITIWHSSPVLFVITNSSFMNIIGFQDWWLTTTQKPLMERRMKLIFLNELLPS